MRLIHKLGIGLLSLGLLGAPETNNNSLLENRVAAAEQTKEEKPEELKESYTFDEIKTALGDRYAKLSDTQKKTVEDNYKKGKEHIKFSYNTILGVVYDKKAPNSLSDEDIEELTKFKISELKKEVLDEYLTAFPWMKRENLAEIDKNPRNPDKILIYYTEFCKELDESLSKAFSGLDGLVYLQLIGMGIDECVGGVRYLSECGINPGVKQVIGETASWYFTWPTKIYEEAKSFYRNRQEKEADKKKKEK